MKQQSIITFSLKRTARNNVPKRNSSYTYSPSKGDTKGTPGVNATNTLNPIYRKVTQQDINNLGLDKINYDPKTGAGRLGKLSNTAH